jgi:hypothetical protein
MRVAIVAAALLLSASPVFGQGAQKASGMKETVTGGGSLPAGWQARRDKKTANTELDNVKFVTMGQGFHATMGMTNAIFWNPANVAMGEFEVHATLTQTRPNEMHPEGAGLVFNGNNLDKDDQSYVYFLVRDGKYLINHRAGAEVHKIVEWTAHPAIKQADANGKTTNKLAVKVQGNDVNYVINDQVVHTQRRDYMKPDGIVGLRVNMHLDMHIADFKLVRAK